MRHVVRRGEGERLWIGKGGDRPVEILVEPATTGTAAFTMGVQNLPPGSQVPLHQHPEEEILFCYSGRARITVAGVTHEVGPETAVFIPGDTYHSIENVGTEEFRMTFTLSPAGYEKVFREMARSQTEHPPVSA
ncbi:MAG: cupin domain-containing protein [Candidatus Rokuibacteriota bacterium]